MRCSRQPICKLRRGAGRNRFARSDDESRLRPLLGAPVGQVTRCCLTWKGSAAGDWQDAAHFLRSADDEDGVTPWATGARALTEACAAKIDVARLPHTGPSLDGWFAAHWPRGSRPRASPPLRTGSR